MSLKTVFAVVVTAAVCLATPIRADKTSPPATTSTPASTTSLADDEAANAAQDWLTQECDSVYGSIASPDPLPDISDSKGCQYLLHDWRNDQVALTASAASEAQSALEAVLSLYLEARQARLDAIGAWKQAETDLAEIVEIITPTTTTTTTTLPPKPTTTTTTTTLPPSTWWCQTNHYSGGELTFAAERPADHWHDCAEAADEWACDVNPINGYLIKYRFIFLLPFNQTDREWHWCNQIPDSTQG